VNIRTLCKNPSLIPAFLVLAGTHFAHSDDVGAGRRRWDDYQVIMWVGESPGRRPEKWPLFLQRLREMGVSAGMIHHDGDPAAYTTNGFPYYVENIVNQGLCLKFNSTVTDWDKFVTGWASVGRPAAAFVRDYSLCDPAWLGTAGGEMARVAARHRTSAPLAYCIRDELSTTLSANPFDYDFSATSLADFRAWLRTNHASLDALNEEWGTAFKAWSEVRPFSTDEIKNRMAGGGDLPKGKPDWQALQGLRFEPGAARREPGRWNFAPWADFRTFMDVSLARALGRIRDAARSVDAETPVGIEGTQMPDTFGGYDLWRLSQVLDWVEPYDIGCAREIFGSFMPGRPILTTVGEPDGRHAGRRLWHLLLEGDRGCLIWWSEDCIDWKSADYALTSRARDLAPVLREMRSDLASIFLHAVPEYDPVWLVYSQPSIQADWLIESTVDGSTWHRRFSSFEAANNRQTHRRAAWLSLFEDLGYSPRFVPADRLADPGHLGPGVIVLPGALALSDAQLAGLRDWRPGPGGGRIFADGEPGCFDEHGRLRAAPFAGVPWVGVAGNAVGVFEPPRSDGAWRTSLRERDIEAYGAERLKVQSAGASEWQQWAAQQGLPRAAIQVPGNVRTRVHRYRLGGYGLAAFERNLAWQMSENLTQAGGNEALETPVKFDAVLPKPAYVYDLVERRALGLTERIPVNLSPWKPSLYAVADDGGTFDAVWTALLAAGKRAGVK
jgi:Beta-galactosidase